MNGSFNAVFCLFWLISSGLVAVIASDTCPPETKCTPQWKCKRRGQGVVVFRSSVLDTCPYQQICCHRDMIDETPMNWDPEQNCGLRNATITVDDSQHQDIAKFGEFPWEVAIFEKNRNENELIGGGSILTPNVVLTAAHTVCRRKPEHLRVHAGEWDIVLGIEKIAHEESEVLVMICHEEFNDGLHNDIAVLNLKSKFNFNYHIGPICLPRTFEYPILKRCFVAGWGKYKFNDATHSQILQKVSLPIINNPHCQQQLRKTRLGSFFELHNSFVCAGGEKDIDTCTGNGGAPLFCPLTDYPNRFYQLGIVAYDIGCMTENVPGVYASVPHLLTWLHEVLHALGVHSNYYLPPFSEEHYYRSEYLKKAELCLR